MYFYAPGDWEEFILEWATALGETYVQVKRIGGAGDQGIDVAGLLSDHGFEGEWDCYQAKHYSDALTPSTAIPEIFKMFRHVADGHYTMPRRYAFVAPKGCGPTLNRLLSHPSEMKAKVLDALSDGSPATRDLAPDTLQALKSLIQKTDFKMFVAIQLIELIDGHARTNYHAFRFGTSLPQRDAPAEPPLELEAHESRYVAQLVEVYSELDPDNPLMPETIAGHDVHGAHFRRQRQAFYSAEALRVYARDSVPPGTFESLLDDVHAGVVEIAEAPHSSGRDRLTAVLTHATQVQLDSHRLVSVTGPEDRKGLCHQLANTDRLTWVSKK
ncbi:ABC-three component system protein [Microbacterium sp. NPDC056736]|uniref:ABC-three component system protein n=1 Tax=Microbacterium sp. NPDC056736 TaxID=3345932 RepID=UPI00366E42FF